MAERPHLRGNEQATPSFVQVPAQQFIVAANLIFIDHAREANRPAHTWESPT